ncbi:hypothetical protein F750_1085 [Streptomyces sp. PAMC 26508]|nr:hypothetical protein F750_1085 [Streptomyces sp. PAMC 26508]
MRHGHERPFLGNTDVATVRNVRFPGVTPDEQPWLRLLHRRPRTPVRPGRPHRRTVGS